MLSTTELFVEHIISGVLSLLWVCLILYGVAGPDAMALFEYVYGLWTIMLLPLTAIAYPLGIIIDTVADRLYLRKEIALKAHLSDETTLSILKRLDDQNIVNYFTYNRFKKRIGRTSVINFTLLTVGSVVAGLRSGHVSVFIMMAIVYSLLAFGSHIVWSTTIQTTADKLHKLTEKYHEH